MVFPGGLVVKNPCAKEGDAGDAGSTPPVRRPPGAAHGNPFQFYFLENS